MIVAHSNFAAFEGVHHETSTCCNLMLVILCFRPFAGQAANRVTILYGNAFGKSATLTTEAWGFSAPASTTQ